MTYNITLQFPQDGHGDKIVSCGTSQTVLDAALRDPSGISMQYRGDCNAGVTTTGICTVCRCKLISGTVTMEQSALSDQDVSDGWILSCAAIPTSDCTILTHQGNDPWW